ncbi:MAG: hypothetical protein RL300_1719 [Pseudomonadota bacterium]
MLRPQRICLMGAAGTGKNILAQALTAHFDGLWVPGYLRLFCDQHSRVPRADEQADIMRAQFEQEEAVFAQATQSGCRYVFSASAPLLTAIYSDFYFADRSLFDCAHALHERYALTLVLMQETTGPSDGLEREAESVRTAVHSRVQHALQAMHFPHIDVEGRGEARLQAAILAVETLSA